MRRIAAPATAALLGVVLLVAACGGAATPVATGSPSAAKTSGSATGTAGKTLSIEVWSAFDSFNPITAQSGYDDSAISLMYDSLDWQSPDGKFHPLLASSWDISPDSKTYTFHINPQAEWTDGQPVTASDVAYTLQLMADPKVPTKLGSYLSPLAGTNGSGQSVDPTKPLAGVKVINSKTFELLMKQPTDPNLLLSTLGNGIYIVPQHVLQSVPDTAFVKASFFQDPTVSDGPFKFVKYVNSQYLQLAANTSYYLGKPPVSTLYVQIVPPTSILPELRDGEIDATLSPGESDVPLQDWPSLTTLSNVKQDPVPGTTTQFMMINTAKPYLASAKVRDAIAMAINVPELVTALLKGQGAVANGPTLPLNATYYDRSLQPWPFDPTKAKQMLQAANFPFSQPLKLLVPTGNQIRQESGPLIQQDLQAVGLNVQIQQYDFATSLAQTKAGNFDFSLIGGFTVDPAGNAIYFACGAPLDYGKFCDPNLDKLFQASDSTAVVSQRQKINDEIQQTLHDEAPFVFLYTPDGLMAYNTRVNEAAVPTAYGMLEPWLWDVSGPQ